MVINLQHSRKANSRQAINGWNEAFLDRDSLNEAPNANKREVRNSTWYLMSRILKNVLSREREFSPENKR